MEEEWHTVVSKKSRNKSSIDLSGFTPLDLKIYKVLSNKEGQYNDYYDYNGMYRGVPAIKIAEILSVNLEDVGNCLYDGPLSKYVVRDPPPGQKVNGKKPCWMLII